jgi:hypothetical protein
MARITRGRESSGPPESSNPTSVPVPSAARLLFIVRARGAKGAAVTVKFTPYDKNNPPGKLADAELHFDEGALGGLKLIGFAVWERKKGGGRNVTFPARQYSVNGERRSFSLLRPIADATAQDRVRELILQAYEEYEEKATIAS